MMNFQVAGGTDVGKIRQHNEDSMIAFDSPNGYVVAVCDGMGGENGGDTASTLAVTIIQDILVNNTFPTPHEAITRACVAANQGILHRASTRPDLQGMGSTCVIAIVSQGHIYYGSIGDSRIYYYTPAQGLQQLTKDQSYVQTLVDSGQITPEEAERHPRKNEILNALGLEGMEPPVIGESPVPVSDGGLLLLCSDGLTGMIPDFTISQQLAMPGLTPQQRCDNLVSLANEAGGYDNSTVQISDCSAGDAAAASQRPEVAAITTDEHASPVAKKSYAWVGMVVICILLFAIGAYLGWDFYSKSRTAPADIPTDVVLEKKAVHTKSPVRARKTIVVTEPEAPKVKPTEPAPDPKSPASNAIKDTNRNTTPSKAGKTIKDTSKKGQSSKSAAPEPEQKTAIIDLNPDENI